MVEMFYIYALKLECLITKILLNGGSLGKEIKMDNYEQLVERIATSSGLEKKEIERRVEAKRAKLSGLVSKEGAAQIVAAELGINFDQEKMKINQLLLGMKRANVVGKVIEIYPVREFNKNGREGKVANLIIADESGNTRVVLWDTNHIFLVENEKIKKGDVVEISNGNIRNNGEIHLNSFSDIKLSKEEIENVVVERKYNEKKLGEAKAGESLKTRAVIVQVFEPRYFEACPQCGKRVLEGKCNTHGEVEGKKRALLNLVLDDGSESIRAVLFGEQINKLELSDEEIFSLEKFALKKGGILGEELVFTGNLRSNALYNTVEFNVEGIEKVKAEELIKELEKKAG